MARLSELVAGIAEALKVEERSVTLCARYLREAGLIQQKGRGPSAAHMGPADATNLLLGVMAADTIKDGPRSVSLAREATFWGGEVDLDGSVVDDLPPYPFLKSGGTPLALGPALDALFDHTVRTGGPENDQGDPVTNFRLEIERPGLHAAMMLTDGSSHYIARYQRTHPDLQDLQGPALMDAARNLRAKTGMVTTTEIDIEILWAIADALRGYVPEEGDIVEPPYDEAPRK